MHALNCKFFFSTTHFLSTFRNDCLLCCPIVILWIEFFVWKIWLNNIYTTGVFQWYLFGDGRRCLNNHKFFIRLLRFASLKMSFNLLSNLNWNKEVFDFVVSKVKSKGNSNILSHKIFYIRILKLWIRQCIVKVTHKNWRE